MEEASYNTWVDLETMSSNFPLKLGGEDEVVRAHNSQYEGVWVHEQGNGA